MRQWLLVVVPAVLMVALGLHCREAGVWSKALDYLERAAKVCARRVTAPSPLPAVPAVEVSSRSDRARSLIPGP